MAWGRRGQPPLQGGQGEAHHQAAAAVLLLDLLGPVHAVADVVGHLVV